jgi:antitoxin component YwqK of YwqJK toxin-antitoxin module
MKLSATIFSLLIYISSFSQSIRFQLFVKTPCTDISRLALNRNLSIPEQLSYHLEKISNPGDTKYRNNETGTIQLPDTGFYKVYIYENGETATSLIEIKDSGLYTYTFEEDKIIFRCLGDPGCFYYNCDSLANGYLEDYYSNGNIKIRGNFVNGKEKDSLVTFYQNGITKTRYLLFSKRRVRYYFDSASHLISIDQYTHFHEWSIVYRGPTYNHRKEYFPNGDIKSNQFLIDDEPYRIKEFYENGNVKIKQTKKSRTEYSENGNVKTKYNWSYKKAEFEDEKGWYDITVHKTEYDTSGKIIEEQIYDKTVLRYKIPPFDIKRSDWIDSWVKFENGKKVFEIKDVDPDKYFKKLKQ